MQWHVQGTDAITGQRITLAMDAPAPEAAVQSAIDRRIVVARVAKGPHRGGLAMALAAACGIALVLTASCATLYWRHQTMRSELQEVLAENARLGSALAGAGEVAATLEQRTQRLEQAQGGAARDLVDQLAAARARLKGVEGQLAAAQSRIVGLEAHSAAAAQARTDLSALQSRAAALAEELQSQQRLVRQLEARQSVADGLQKTNRDLAAQVALLKNQLLEQTAKSLGVPVMAQPAEPPALPPRPPRWAIGASYDQTSDFIALHFDRDAAATAPGDDGTLVTTSLLTANAATIRVTSDTLKDRIYSVTLSLSLAADAPREKRTENLRLLGDFVRKFAPGFKEPDAWLAAAIKQLAGKNAGERVVRLGDDFKLTAWNNGAATYSWKIESPRGDLENAPP